MNLLYDIVQKADFWKIAFPALAAIVAWFFNERKKLAWEQYQRKEENYKELLRCLKGFYVATQERDLKNQFLHQVNLLWLYAPDDVISTVYRFLFMVHTGVVTSDHEKELACGAIVEAVRKDLLSHKVLKKTKLSAKDFRRLIST